jgi:hypothetical protein
MNKTSRWILYTLGGLLVTFLAHTAVYAQGSVTRANKSAVSNARVQKATQKAVLAESVVALRESATGRRYNPAYRASLKSALISLPTARLESLKNAGGKGSLGLDAVGDISTNLVYTPVTPCRLFDTRYSTAGILVGGTQRNFQVTDYSLVDFTTQGGTSGGCGIPYGTGTSVMINFAAVTPTGSGNLRAWAVAEPQPAAPLAAVMNYSTSMPAIANGVAVPICDDTTSPSSCSTGDLRLQADVNSVHVVGDVVGYFRKLDLPAAMPMGNSHFGLITITSGEQYKFSTTDVVLPNSGNCLVTCNVDVVATSTISTGFLEITTARRDVAAALEDYDDGEAMDLPMPSNWGSASVTHTWSMMAGKTYNFGCNFWNEGGGFVGKNAYANVSWICR